jgi:hypothetical protein
VAATALVNNRFLPRGQPPSGGGGSGLWELIGNDVSLVENGNTVTIGADAPVGSEKVRIVGDLRVEGQVLGDELRAEDTSGGTTAVLTLDDGVTAAVSAAGEGRIRFNATTMAIEVSEDGGAYTPIFAPSGGGWTDDGTIVRLTTSTDDVAIGIAAMVGAERLRVTGDVRFEGQTLSDSFRAEDTAAGSGAYLEMDDGSTAAVSAVDEGRFRYNETNQQFEISENAGPYQSLVAGSAPYTCPVGVTVGDAVYISGSDAVSQANATDVSTSPALGFVRFKPTATTCIVQSYGDLSEFAGLIAGDTYYLDDSAAGAITNTAPSTSGTTVQPVGFARNGTTLVIIIDPADVVNV